MAKKQKFVVTTVVTVEAQDGYEPVTKKDVKAAFKDGALAFNSWQHVSKLTVRDVDAD